MNAEDFEKASEIDLRRKANECFEELARSGAAEKPALLLQAQFYMDEIERRKQDRVANRDLRLELLVIILIALELYFGISGGNDQIAVLKKIDVNTAQTVCAVKVLNESLNERLTAVPCGTENRPANNLRTKRNGSRKPVGKP